MSGMEAHTIDVITLILTMTITGSIVSAFLFAIKPVIKDRLPKTFQYYMWFPVIIALILPLSEAAVPPVWSRPAAPVGAAHDLAQWIADTALERPVNTVLAPQPGSGQETMRTALYVPDAAAILFGIWQFGMLLTLGYHVAGYVRYARKIRRYNKCAGRQEAELLRALSDGRHTPRLYQNAFVATPVLIGVLHPEMILPDKKYAETELQSIFLHEMTHMRRHDIAVKWLLVFAGALHWFNPVIRCVCREINRACELACDESVIKKYDNDQKQHYGDALITVAADTVRGIPASITMFEDKKNLKERLEAIMRHRDFSKKTVFISGILLGIVICATLCIGTARASAHRESGGIITYEDESPAQRQRHKKEIELKQAISDYDPNNITGVWVYLGYSDQEITSANIMVASKDKITDADELDQLKAVAAQHLDLAAQDINLECMDMETFTTSPQDYYIDADQMDTDSDKEQAYLDYLTKILTETIEEVDGVAGCEIAIDYSEGKIASARVNITAEDSETNILETDILDYISHGLDIPAENVALSVD